MKSIESATRAPGPSGKLPLTIEQVVEAPSGHIFGYSQNAGMGWNPDELGRENSSSSARRAASAPRTDGQSRWATTPAIGKSAC